jgi:hypothetical protein
MFSVALAPRSGVSSIEDVELIDMVDPQPSVVMERKANGIYVRFTFLEDE